MGDVVRCLAPPLSELADARGLAADPWGTRRAPAKVIDRLVNPVKSEPSPYVRLTLIPKVYKVSQLVTGHPRN
jgi:hypothetical protein